MTQTQFKIERGMRGLRWQKINVVNVEVIK